MSETESEPSKYNIQIGQAQGLAVGDNALYVHIEHFHATPPPPPPASREELLTAIQQASAELRNYSNEIVGIHLERTEVGQIVEWALNADSKERLVMLLDQPGGGKTVVMRDVLERLEAKRVPTLAIKADTLSGIRNRSDLADRLGVPARVEECVRHLATEGLIIVLLDQLDALSLTLSRDQTTLDVTLNTLNRLRDLDNVRIIASCRTFDLNNDPRLSTIKVDRKFQLQPLAEAQVNRVLQKLGLDSTRLLSGHRILLTTPLHLDVYVRILTAGEAQRPPESFRTLQELYEVLWQKRIETVPPDAPPPAKRIEAIYRLVEVMQNLRQTTALLATLDEFPEAANYLERIGFLRREKSNWLFLHQTLYDYCYARRFVAQGWSLSQEILASPQELFERAQMVQVLAYLRGSNRVAYHRELNALLFARTLRSHLRLLLIRWFGALPAPTDDELRIARRLMKDTGDRIRFLRAISENGEWFDRLSDSVLPALLRTSDDKLIEAVITYLWMIIQQRPEAVLARLEPYLGKSETWDDRIAFCLTRLNDWKIEKALDMLCALLERGKSGGQIDSFLYSLSQSNPAGGCRVLRIYLDRRMDTLLAEEQRKRQAVVANNDPNAAYRDDLPDRFTWGRELVGEYGIGELMERATQVYPEAVIEYLLPWFVRAAQALSEPDPDDDIYPSDSLFAWGWHGDHLLEGAVFAIRVSNALRHLAQTQPTYFRIIAAQLVKIETLAVQRVLAEAYLSDLKEYASDIFEYLLADPRRLNIGESLGNSRYDSCRLYGAAFQYVNEQGRVTLEQLILNLYTDWEKRSPQSRGLTQLRFLKSVNEPGLFSETARRRLQELERKFPGFKPQPPQGTRGGRVGSPINQAAQAKMSDEAWLGAMRKYSDSGFEHPDILKGGVHQLSSSFAEQVKKEPERFYRLALRFDETISLHYITAAISGLTDSDAPVEWVFDLVRQFAPRLEGEFRRAACWALEKRAEVGVPDDLLDLITEWALNDPNPAEELWRVPAGGEGQPYYGGDPHHHGINSNRGTAVNIVCRCALKREPVQVERAFQLLEKVADDPSTAVRTCVIESLGPLLNEDDTRALVIFVKTLDGHPRLLQTQLVHRFLYWTYYYHFPEICPFTEALLTDPDEATRQAGARLVCLAAFRYEEAKDLETRVMSGDSVMRRGAAEVYAHNLKLPDLMTTCEGRLRLLMQDPDEKVRSYVGECFEYLDPEYLADLRSFIDEFLESPSLLAGAKHLLNFLVPLAVDEHELALTVTAQILDAVGAEVVDIRTSRALLERDLVRLPLTVYTHADDPEIKSQAMALFERLLLMGSREAQQALSDWDRQ
ncbi:MAG: ATP-binding protein [Anaerolineae bacterium]|nr:ATP-binding protein [Anaerolineae bacterium]